MTGTDSLMRQSQTPSLPTTFGALAMPAWAYSQDEASATRISAPAHAAATSLAAYDER
jgi:hypothetical protein